MSEFKASVEELKRLAPFAVMLIGILALFLGFFYFIQAKPPAQDTPPTPVFHSIDNATEWEKSVEDNIRHAQQQQALLAQRMQDLQVTIDQNASTLGMIATFFGALITVVVIFFAIKQDAEVRRVIDEADRKLEKMTNALEEAKKIEQKVESVKSDLEEHKKEVPNMVESTIEKHLEEQVERFTTENSEDIEKAQGTNENERTAYDWRAIAIENYDKKEYLKAAKAYEQWAEKTSSETQKANAHIGIGSSYIRAEKPQEAIKPLENFITWAKDKKDKSVITTLAVSWCVLTRIYVYDLPETERGTTKALKIITEFLEWSDGKDNTMVAEMKSEILFILEKIATDNTR